MKVELAIKPAQEVYFVHVVTQVESSPGTKEIMLASSAAGATFEPVN